MRTTITITTQLSPNYLVLCQIWCYFNSFSMSVFITSILVMLGLPSILYPVCPFYLNQLSIDFSLICETFIVPFIILISSHLHCFRIVPSQPSFLHPLYCPTYWENITIQAFYWCLATYFLYAGSLTFGIRMQKSDCSEN